MTSRTLFVFASTLALLGFTACNDSGFQDSSATALETVQPQADRAPEYPSDPTSENPTDYSLEEYSLAACDEPGTTKVLVCHIPPGNPAAAHTICVSRNGAIHGHGLDLSKPAQVGGHGGDRLGDCTKLPPEPSPSPVPSASPSPELSE
jgi:hypothetical protein